MLYFSNIFGDPENFIPANPLVTPTHIKPEWYFLWAYAILRSIPNKLGGIIAIFSAMLILLTLPFTLPNFSQGIQNYPLTQVIFWSFCAVCVLLTWIGARPVEAPYEELGAIFTILYFSFFLITPFSYITWDNIIRL